MAAETRRRDPVKSRARLLRAGLRRFARSGPEAASVSDIVRDAGLNRRMLYHYYGSKEGLYAAVFRHVYEQLRGIEMELVGQRLEAEELIRRLFRGYFRYFAGHPAEVRILSWENLRLGQAARRANISLFKAPMVKALAAALRRGRSAGRIRRDADAREILISCMALSYFYFSNRYTVGEALGVNLANPRAVQAHARAVVNMLLDGVRVRPRTNRGQRGLKAGGGRR